MSFNNNKALSFSTSPSLLFYIITYN